MKAWICKAMTIAIACSTFMGAVLAHAQSCSDASLSGRYGQTISGEILPGNGVVLPQNGIAMTNFDGKGKFTQVDFVVIAGANQSTNFQGGETGTYKVNADCTGHARINYKSGAWIDLELVVVSQGREFRTVVSALNMGGNNVPANIGSSGTRVDNSGSGDSHEN